MSADDYQFTVRLFFELHKLPLEGGDIEAAILQMIDEPVVLTGRLRMRSDGLYVEVSEIDTANEYTFVARINPDGTTNQIHDKSLEDC